MANYITGKDGYLNVNNRKIAKVASWSLTNTVDALEVTSLDDVARDYTPGLMSAQGTCTVWLYEDNANVLLSKVIRNDRAPDDRDKVTLRLGFGAKKLDFQCLITQSQLVMTVGEVMQAQLSFQVCGVFTLVDLEG